LTWLRWSRKTRRRCEWNCRSSELILLGAVWFLFVFVIVKFCTCCTLV
jgi:hypothetical protein